MLNGNFGLIYFVHILNHLIALTRNGFQALSIEYADLATAIMYQLAFTQIARRLSNAYSAYTQHVAQQILC